MKTNVKLILGALVLIAVSVAASYIITKRSIEPISCPATGEANLGYNQGSNNTISSVTSLTTSTAVGLPVLLLARNATRQYCYITNNSATAIYLTFKNFSTDVAASTSVGAANGGLYLAASGGRYECLPQNMVVSDIWASSTASGLSVSAGQQ